MEKIKYTFLAFLLPLMGLGQNLNWQAVNMPYLGRVNSILFVDSLKGYATQENKLLNTLDGGNSWHLVDSLSHQSNQNKTYFGMLIKVADSIYISAGNSASNYILKLKLDSSNFTLDSTKQDGRFLRDYSFKNGVFFGIDSNQAFVSYNQNTKQTHYSYATDFSVEQNRILVADYSNLYSSNDMGLNWDTISLPSIFNHYSPNEIVQFNQDTFCVRYVGFPTEEYITLNGGVSWQVHDTVFTVPNRRPRFYQKPNYSNIVVGNFNNLFLYSRDLGFNFYSDTITSSTSGNNMAFFKTYANSWETVFIYGDSGKVYKTSNYDQITRLNEKKKRVPTISLSPNPTNGSLRISPAVCQSVSEVSIYNQNGQIVATLKNPCQEIDVSDLKTGIYIVSGIYQTQQFSSKIVVQTE